jgi:hypothetical protein
MRRDADRWVIEFEDPSLEASWYRGLPSDALREAEDFLRRTGR